VKSFSKILVSGLLALSTISLAPLAASAHDEVAGTNPTADSTVAAGIIDVSVSFGEDIMATPNNSGEVIEVVGPEGAESATWSNACVTVTGTKVSTQVDLDKPGIYTVNWRNVSSDGHATEGSFNFKLENTTNYTSGGLVEPSAECASAQPILIAPAPSHTSHPLPATDPFVTNLPYLGFGIGLTVLFSIASVLVVDRRNKRAAEAAKKKAPASE